MTAAQNPTVTYALKTPVPTQYTLYGGYGYNYQYLGNSRNVLPNNAPFRLRDAQIKKPTHTLVVGDTEGANNGTDGQYVGLPPNYVPGVMRVG